MTLPSLEVYSVHEILSAVGFWLFFFL